MRLRTLLTKPVIEEIATIIREGLPVSQAAAAAGVSPRSVAAWMERGRTTSDILSLPAQLYAAVTQARAEAERRYVNTLNEHAKADWRAAAFILERTNPETWAKHAPVTRQTSVQINMIEQGADRLARTLEAMSARGIGPGPPGETLTLAPATAPVFRGSLSMADPGDGPSGERGSGPSDDPLVIDIGP